MRIGLMTVTVIRAFGLVLVLAAGVSAADTGEHGSSAVPAFVTKTLGDVAAKASRAVVRIHVDRFERTRASLQFSMRRQSRMRRIARQEEEEGSRPHTDREDWALIFRYLDRPSGPASGVLVEPSGLVLTALYNVEGPIRSIRVEVQDGRSYPAEVLGWDRNLDVAALQVQADGVTFPSLPLESLPPPKVGSFVVVVGASWGRVPYTANAGTVSALNRLGGDALQVNAHFNYANTGGAVLDLEGRLLAIAGHIRPFNRTGMNSGVGLVTGAARLLQALPDLKRGKRIPYASTPFLGIRTDQDEAQKRVYIEQVVPDSGAERAGVKAGDMLISIAGTPIQEQRDVWVALTRTRVGEVVELVVQRGGKTMKFAVTLGVRD